MARKQRKPRSPNCRSRLWTNWPTRTRLSLARQRASATWPRRCAISSIRRDPCGQGIADRKDRERVRFHRDATRRAGDHVDELPHHPPTSRHGNRRRPYSESGLAHMGDITRGTPYGATTLAGPDGSRQPSANELKIARYRPLSRKARGGACHEAVPLGGDRGVTVAARRCRLAPGTCPFCPCS